MTSKVYVKWYSAAKESPKFPLAISSNAVEQAGLVGEGIHLLQP